MSRAASQPVPVDRIEAAAYQVPTEVPESDGTLDWEATTLVVAQAHADGHTGIGYTYAGPAATRVIVGKLGEVVSGQDALTPAASWAAMQHAVRNLGKPGLVAECISAVDIALWDLYARLVDLPLSVALGAVHTTTPIYGSGGFTNYTEQQLTDQLTGWVQAGIPRVKIKVGRDPDDDPARLAAARTAIGDDVELFVDANGAYTRKEALLWAHHFADHDVRWFEEPVNSDDLAGLRLLRDQGPAGMSIAAGEYGYHLPYFHQLLLAEAVDCLQADPTRALGVTGTLRVGALCDAHCLDLSLHCAPQISAQVGTAIWHIRHLEYFHDHVRIEHLAFDGVLEPEAGGVLRPDRGRPGHGLTLKAPDLADYRVA